MAFTVIARVALHLRLATIDAMLMDRADDIVDIWVDTLTIDNKEYKSGSPQRFPTFFCALPRLDSLLWHGTPKPKFNMDNDFYHSHASKQKRTYKIQDPQQMLEEQIQTVDSR